MFITTNNENVNVGQELSMHFLDNKFPVKLRRQYIKPFTFIIDDNIKSRKFGHK